ncbi:MAG: tetratricopeptide repeat protein [Acidobacteria bacterium]|nr:tetratricopeptide repeat protein [Acidobacteriota bacterium]
MNVRQRIHWLLITLGVILSLSFGFGAYLIFRNHRPGSHLETQKSTASEQRSDIEALLKEGARCLRNHQAEQALMAYRQVLAHHPTSLAAQLGLAQGELLAGRDAMAAQEYERVLGIDEKNTVALLQLARLYSHERQGWKRSEEVFQRYLELKPENPEAQLGLARVLAWQGKAQQAVEIFSRKLVAALMNQQDQRDFAFALIKTGKHEQAEPVLHRLLAERPGDFELKLQLASLYASRKDWDSALPLYRALLQERPNDARVNLTYGLGLLAIKNYSSALGPLQKACAALPNSGEGCLGYARAFKGTGKLKEAAKQFERAMPHYSGNAAITREYADLLLEKRDYRNSEKQYKTAYSIGLRDDALLVGLAGALRGNGKPKEALAYLEELYRRQPTDRIALELAKLHKKLGNNNRALELLEKIESSAKSKPRKDRA